VVPGPVERDAVSLLEVLRASHHPVLAPIGEPMSAFADAVPILLSWDRCLGYIRLWHEKKLSDHDALEALVMEIATTNGDLNRKMAAK
jgi:hypothetical protein